MSKRDFMSEHNDTATRAIKRKTALDDRQTIAADTPKCTANNDYTVGWICAITTEYVAAQAFLDEKHNRPEYVSLKDDNIYTLGRVGKHNVVMAALPDGEYGIAAAASVAKDLLNSCPNIRIGLMVGIGGGAPSRKRDIRLGDIVVSAPRNGQGGVFQYDFGKTIQDQTFQTIGFLDQPPALLRGAVSDIRAEYESEGHQIEDTISSVLEKKPRMQKKYKRPDPSSDRLYQSRVVHPRDEGISCEATCSDDPSTIVLRPKRTKEEDNPAIHYGLIASANQLMKDATVRDKLAAEKDVLCFEMEAAGLMNHFPCLVIRGICDYSDSHKNKEWQGYAALVAAAYAKDLLRRIPPNKVEAEKRINDILSEVQQGVGKLLRVQHDQEHKAILDWLTLVEYAPQQNDFIARRQEGTGTWLLNSTEYQSWRETKGRTLFCPGIPGAGKTILTAIVIDELTTQFSDDLTIGIAYMYCNFRRQDEQKINDLLASLLKQLAETQLSLPSTVKELYNRHKTKRTRPSFDGISKSLQAITALYSRVFIIVDALDECQVSNSCRQRFLLEMFNLQANHGVNLYATSRFIPEITTKFQANISLEIRASKEDIGRYLEAHMRHLSPFDDWDRQLQDEIKVAIADAVDGIFLLAQIYLGSLDDKTTPRAVRSALMQFRRQSLGSSEDQKREMLDKAYKDVMERINRQQLGFRRLAEKVLSWITCTKRPLTTLELQHALAVVVGDSKLDEDNLERTERMVSVCAGLVTIDEESGIIRFVHYTTQEYFERTQERWFPDAESEITKTCITYLSFSSFNTGLCATDEQFEARIRENALYRYAAKHWGNHARAALAATDQLVLRFLEKETKLTACTQAMLAPEQYSGQLSYSQNVPQHMIGVHVAAYFGLENTLASLLGNGYDLDVRDTYNRTPLSWATKQGHKAVVRLLLEQDPELELKDNRQGQTPLSLAAKHGHEVIVHQLLEQGAEVESNDKSSKTPLFLAAQKGHEAVVRLLLEWDAEVDSKDTGGHTPLSLAAMYGYVPVVRLLLEQGAEVGSRDTWGHTPLSLAARNGYEAIVRLLLEHGAELWSRDRTGRTPLSYASENGHEEAAKLLLEKAVDLDSRDKDTYYGRTPLLWAARNGHEAIIKLLLEKAVSVDTKDHYGQTALSYVAWHGLEATVRLLLDKAVDVDSKDIYYGRTPLSYASENGHEVVVTLLLGNTVDMQSKSNSGRTPLMYAKENGQEAVVNLLQEKAVDVNSNSNSHWIQLSYVAGNRGKTDNIPKKLHSVIDGDIHPLDISRKGSKAWELGILPCVHTPILRLKQQVIRKIDSQNLGKCYKCDLRESLWFCLQCGNLGCRRAQFGMPGGNGHGIEHYKESRHPIVVRLGTVTPESTADVYCYECDESRLDPELGPHLAYWGFEIAASEKTEKSLMEMQIELGEVQLFRRLSINSLIED